MMMESIRRVNAIEIPLSGKLDLNNARILEQKFINEYLESDVDVIGINMADLRFLDSSGLSIIMRLTSEAQRKAKKIFFISLSPSILSVIKVARLDSFLQFMSADEFNLKYPLA